MGAKMIDPLMVLEVESLSKAFSIFSDSVRGLIESKLVKLHVPIL